MKRYKFEVVIFEGNDEFWESIGDKSGCDEVQKSVETALAEIGYFASENADIKLVEFTNKE